MEDEGHQDGAVSITAPSAEAVAGGKLTVSVNLTADPACDLRELTVLIKDGEGAVIHEAPILYFDGEVSSTGDVDLDAPPRAGDMAWTVAFEGATAEGVDYAEASAPLNVTITPQAMRMMVWDIPPTTAIGGSIRVKVGVKSSTGLDLTGTELAVYDEDGNRLAVGTAGPEPWRDTKALYHAELEIAAPNVEGHYNWEARVAESDEKVSVAAGSTAFGVHIVKHPEHIVTVEAIDQETQAPVPGARVVMHPYRGVTDERGIAQIHASAGDYTLFISKKKYDPMSRAMELTGDIVTKVELVHEEPEPDPGDYYV